MTMNYRAVIGRNEQNNEIYHDFERIDHARAYCLKDRKAIKRNYIPCVKDLHHNKIMGYVCYYPEENRALWSTDEEGVLVNEVNNCVTAYTSDSVYYEMYEDGGLGRRMIADQTVIHEIGEDE